MKQQKIKNNLINFILMMFMLHLTYAQKMDTSLEKRDSLSINLFAKQFHLLKISPKLLVGMPYLGSRVIFIDRATQDTASIRNELFNYYESWDTGDFFTNLYTPDKSIEVLDDVFVMFSCYEGRKIDNFLVLKLFRFNPRQKTAYNSCSLELILTIRLKMLDYNNKIISSYFERKGNKVFFVVKTKRFIGYKKIIKFKLPLTPN